MKKNKMSLYMDSEHVKMLDEIYIKRLRNGNKTNRSTIVCKAIRLLYLQEVEGIPMVPDCIECAKKG